MIRIGVNLAVGLAHTPGGNVIDELVRHARTVAAAGVPTVWLPQGYDHDTLTAFAAVAREVPGVELGASVVVVQPRHPRVLAAQAQTVQAASHGRLTLGLGVSHRGLLEVYGIPFDRPVEALREHLDILLPILAGDRVPGATGPGSSPEETAVRGATPAVPVLLGALGPVMLRLAGERACGTITFLAGPRTIGEHVVPRLAAAAAAAGRPRPRVVAGLPVAVTPDPERVRAQVTAEYAAYATLPTYRTALDREGFSSLGDIVIAGGQEQVADGLRRYAELGATDVLVSLVGDAEDRDRTLRLLGELGGLSPAAASAPRSPSGSAAAPRP